MRLWYVVALVALVPSVQACSLAYTHFEVADLGDDILLTAMGQDAVRIDLDTGTQTVLAQDFFPRVAIDDDARWLYIGAQEGLGADCSGDNYLTARTPTGVPREGAGADAFDVHDRVALVRDGTVHITAVGRFDGGQTFTVPTPADDPFRSFNWAIAIRDQVAVTAGDDVHVHALDGDHVTTISMEQVRVLAWHRSSLVVAAGYEDPTFTVDGSVVLEAGGDGWLNPHIAAGRDLYLHHGDDVVLVGATTQQLVIPDGYQVANIAADDDGAVLLVQEAGYPDAPIAGIQRLVGATFGDWLVPDKGAWVSATAPAWSWEVVSTPSTPSTPNNPTTPPAPEEGAPGAMPLYPLLAALFVARRIR